VHQGQIIAQYREKMGLTQKQLADELRVHERTILRLESTPMVRSISRRWFLVGLLGIPASQLDLEGEPPWSKKRHLPVNNDCMGFFESELRIRWQFYKMSGSGNASPGIDAWTGQVEEFVKSCQGTPWHKRALALLSMTYQLEGSIFRDGRQYTQTYTLFENAYRVAHEANNDELMAATLLREGMAYMAQEKPFQAITNFNGALDHIKDLSFPRLRGKLLQARAEAYALAQRPEECWTSVGLATHHLGQEEHSQEQNQAIFSASSVTVWKGLYALLLRDYERAITLFDKGLISYDPSLAPDRARFLSRKAEAYYGAHRVGDAIETAQEALTLAASIGKQSTIERVRTLHTQLVRSKWRNETGLKALGASLQQYSTSSTKL